MKIRTLVNIMGIFSYVLSRIGCLALFLMMSLTVVDVARRHAFNAPMLGAFEITQFLIAILIFSFVGYTQSQDSHVTVDILVNRFPKKAQGVINLFNFIVTLTVMVLITWQGIEKGFETMAAGDSPMNLPVPTFPFIFYMALGCGVMCLEMVRSILRTVVKKLQDESVS